MREDSRHILFADRSFTITPTNQPTSPVSVRLYITNAEFNAIKTGVNSQGIGTGINTISDIRIFKNSDPCTSQFSTSGIWITPTISKAFGSGGYVLQFDISSFSSFYLTGSSMTVLPVRLISFDGAMVKNIADLTWKTENEKGVSYFSIERSFDGRSFIPIGKVNAEGTSEGARDYQFQDNDACLQQSNMVYYRLKIVDANGSYEYSRVIKMECSPSGMAIDIYPNPVHQVMKVKLDLQRPDNVNIQVTDMTGRVISNTSRYMPAGKTELELDTQTWLPQMYAVKVTAVNSNVQLAKNVIKQ
jgi:trimeric autotransporter adhesin